MEQVEDKDPHILPQAVRLNRFIAMAGLASRRKAEELILNGEVRVNGHVVTDLATRVVPGQDRVVIAGQKTELRERPVYLVLNKPKDCITTASDERRRRTVFDLVNVPERVFTVGRLDRDTTGVLLFTNDGLLANRLMHPSHEVTKTYHATLSESLGARDLERLKRGVILDGTRTAPAHLDVLPSSKNRDIIITIHEGRNRQVRRMFEQLGYDVKRLDRIDYGGITAAGLRRGHWRFLTSHEVRSLKKRAGLPEGSSGRTAS